MVSGTAVNKEWIEVWPHGYLEVGADVHSCQARKDGNGPETLEMAHTAAGRDSLQHLQMQVWGGV